jgi:hypothetical protein
MTKEQILQAVDAVIRIGIENASHMVADPAGDYPRCKPLLWTYSCERCGQDVRGCQGPCPAVPPEKRWRYDDFLK